MGFFNSFALKHMAKEHLVTWYRQSGFGNPPAGASASIEDAAAAMDSHSEAALQSALDRYARAVGNERLLVLMGMQTLAMLIMEFPQYEWAMSCIEKWDQSHG